MNEEDVDWTTTGVPTRLPNLSSSQMKPLWQRTAIKLATVDDIEAALDQSQLRSRCLHEPPDATFKDIIRHCTFLAMNGLRYEIGMGVTNPRPVVAIPVPSVVVLNMTTRFVNDNAHIMTKFRKLCRDIIGATTAPETGVPNFQVDSATFRKFFIRAIAEVSFRTITEEYAAIVAGVEWRRMTRTDTGRSTIVCCSKPTASLEAFAQCVLQFSLLCCSNGSAFAPPLPKHLSNLIDLFNSSVLPMLSSAKIPPPPAQPPRQLTMSSTMTRTALVPVLKDPSMQAVPKGFLPPGTPKSREKMARQLQLLAAPKFSPRSVSIPPLPQMIVMPTRIVDLNDPATVDLSDAAIGTSISVNVHATEGEQQEQRTAAKKFHQAGLADSRSDISKSAALRLRLKILEKYPRAPQ